ncbi:unnamed protein product [Amoebophrya sp. A120]|nr:unnamed protein product [Amoebophrya sp. A120]|eukprot:GSA120T00006064001.1
MRLLHQSAAPDPSGNTMVRSRKTATPVVFYHIFNSARNPHGAALLATEIPARRSWLTFASICLLLQDASRSNFAIAYTTVVEKVKISKHRRAVNKNESPSGNDDQAAASSNLYTKSSGEVNSERATLRTKKSARKSTYMHQRDRGNHDGETLLRHQIFSTEEAGAPTDGSTPEASYVASTTENVEASPAETKLGEMNRKVVEVGLVPAAAADESASSSFHQTGGDHGNIAEKYEGTLGTVAESEGPRDFLLASAEQELPVPDLLVVTESTPSTSAADDKQLHHSRYTGTPTSRLARVSTDQDEDHLLANTTTFLDIKMRENSISGRQDELIEQELHRRESIKEQEQAPRSTLQFDSVTSLVCPSGYGRQGDSNYANHYIFDIGKLQDPFVHPPLGATPANPEHPSQIFGAAIPFDADYHESLADDLQTDPQLIRNALPHIANELEVHGYTVDSVNRLEKAKLASLLAARDEKPEVFVEECAAYCTKETAEILEVITDDLPCLGFSIYRTEGSRYPTCVLYFGPNGIMGTPVDRRDVLTCFGVEKLDVGPCGNMTNVTLLVLIPVLSLVVVTVVIWCLRQKYGSDCCCFCFGEREDNDDEWGKRQQDREEQRMRRMMYRQQRNADETAAPSTNVATQAKQVVASGGRTTPTVLTPRSAGRTSMVAAGPPMGRMGLGAPGLGPGTGRTSITAAALQTLL